MTAPYNNQKTNFVSPLSMLYQWEAKHADKVVLHQRDKALIRTFSWGQVALAARKVAAAIEACGFPDGSCIGILAKNRAEWFITDLGIMMAGHISVPLFHSASAKTSEYILKHAEVRLLFVGDMDNQPEVLDCIPSEIKTVCFDDSNIAAGQGWSEFIDIPPITAFPVPAADDVMTIIYTSGSTGEPKGVMHSYRTVSWAAQAFQGRFATHCADRCLSYLPLAHILERVLIELGCLYGGFSVYFNKSQQEFKSDLAWCKPTIFISVPRLWTKFQQAILSQVSQRRLNLLLKIPGINTLVRRKIKNALGFADVRIWGSGSAPLPAETISWFYALGIKISEAWGMTENSIYATANLPFNKHKIGSIGQSFSEVEMRLSTVGEIQIRSPGNMLGYYKAPENTKASFTEDGFLNTGDRAVVDADGYFTITGRIKDIFKTAKGKYVAPAPIEMKLMENNYLEQVCVTGQGLVQPVALVVLSGHAEEVSQENILQSLAQTLDSLNRELDSHEKIPHLLIVRDPWTIESGGLTATLKVRRHFIEQQMRDVITGSYNNKVEYVYSDN